MSYPLAVFVPAIGVRSESFIRRHLHDLLPSGTIAIAAAKANGEYGGHWEANCPALVLEGLGRTWEGGARFLARKIGMPAADMAGRAVARFLKKHQVQVILGEYLDRALPWLPLAQDLGIRFFGHAHGYDVSRSLREAKWQEEYLHYNRSHGVIVRSERHFQRLATLGIVESKLHLVHGGVDVPAQPAERGPHKGVRCLAVGRMVAKKAPILTLDAFRRAAEVHPDLRLDYVGAGELLPAVKQFVSALHLSDRVTLHVGVSDEMVQRLMAEADIFLQHSITDPDTGDEEGLPAAITEAMAQSLPVVATRHAGIPEAVLEGSTGYLVDEGNSVAMGERIIELAGDEALRRSMGIAGWQRAKVCFAWQKERTELLRIMGLEC